MSRCQDWEKMGVNMLATSFDMMKCGLSKSWDTHPLGRPLFRRIFEHLGIIGDLQTVATIICTLGGATVVANLLDEPELYSSQKFDRILQRYGSLLSI